MLNRAAYQPVKVDPKGPLQLAEAENAVEIARVAGAEKYAADTFQKALVACTTPRTSCNGKSKDRKRSETNAREAAQMAEDARIITFRKIQEEQLAAERAAAAQREADAQAKARQEAERARQEQERRAQAEADQHAADQARAAAEQERLRAEQATRRSRERRRHRAPGAGRRRRRQGRRARPAAGRHGRCRSRPRRRSDRAEAEKDRSFANACASSLISILETRETAARAHRQHLRRALRFQ